jgi:hypothetical protein
VNLRSATFGKVKLRCALADHIDPEKGARLVPRSICKSRRFPETRPSKRRSSPHVKPNSAGKSTR